MNRTLIKILTLGCRFLLISVLNFALSKIIISSIGMYYFGFLANIAGLSAFAVLIYNILGSSIQRALAISMVGDEEKTGQGVHDAFVVSKRISGVLYFMMALVFAVVLLLLPNKILSPGIDVTDRLKCVAYTQILASLSMCLITPQVSFLYFTENTTAILLVSVFDVASRLSVAIFVGYIAESKLEWLVTLNFIAAITYAGIINFIMDSFLVKYKSPQTVAKAAGQYWKSEILSVSSWGLVGGICGLIFSSGFNMVIANHSGIDAVGYRNIGQQIGNSIVQLPSNMYALVSQRINREMAAGDLPRIFIIMVNSSELLAIGCLVLFLPLFDCLNLILSYMLPNLSSGPEFIIRVSLIIALLELQSLPVISVAGAHGKLRSYVTFVGSSVLVNLFVLAILAKCGVTIGNLFVIAVVLGLKTYFVRLILICQIFPSNFIRTMKSCIAVPSLIGVGIGMLYFFGDFLSLTGVSIIIYKVIIYLSACGLYWKWRGQNLFSETINNNQSSLFTGIRG